MTRQWQRRPMKEHESSTACLHQLNRGKEEEEMLACAAMNGVMTSCWGLGIEVKAVVPVPAPEPEVVLPWWQPTLVKKEDDRGGAGHKRRHACACAGQAAAAQRLAGNK
jgi:hypothetical protein